MTPELAEHATEHATPPTSAVPQYVPGTSTPTLYGLALLQYAARYGCTDFSADQLALADHMYPLALYGYGKQPDDVAHADRMTTLRHRILTQLRALQAAQEARDRMLTEWIAAQDERAQDAQTAGNEANDAQPEPDPRDVALRLMRAALTMIQGMDDAARNDQDGGGGARIPRKPIAPRFPPSGAYATPDRDGTQPGGVTYAEPPKSPRATRTPVDLDF